MTTIRPFKFEDMLRFNNVNLDPLTETYDESFYADYLSKVSHFFYLAESPRGEVMGYLMGNVDGVGEKMHGHVTALSIGPNYRRLGLATTLLDKLEEICEEQKAFYIDLFVRKGNEAAIKMYMKQGFVVYSTIVGYYKDSAEDAYDMRKSCSRDVLKKSMIPLPYPVFRD